MQGRISWGAGKEQLGCREVSVEAAGKEVLAMKGRISWGCREGTFGVQGRIIWRCREG
jgi:hypothetical protein